MKNKILLSSVLISLAIQVTNAETISSQGVVSWRTNSNFFNQPTISKKSTRSTSDEENQALTYLNQLRSGTGLAPFKLNTKLNQAAQNHADYLLVNNLFTHDEDSANPNFTGVHSWDRGSYVGYDWSSYGENISSGDPNILTAIDGLFSAIYHRLGFLTYVNEEVGVGSFYNQNYMYDSAHVFNMATEKPKYGNDIAETNPKIILWPYDGYQNAQALFTNTEYPAPLPECTYGGPSGNPISIQFNTYKSGSITTDSFILYDKNGQIVQTKFLDSQNNDHLHEGEIVLFPINRLDWGSDYSVAYKYYEDGESKNINWSFKTRQLDYPVLKLDENGATYKVENGKTYAFYTVPDNCNDVNTYYKSYDPSKLSLEGDWIDQNTHYVKIIANEGATTSLQLGNGKIYYFEVIKEKISSTKKDYNNDSISDIFWRDQTTGENHLWLIHKDATREFIPQSTKETTYKIAGTGDFNGDGTTDIFWRNGANNYLWLMKEDGSHRYILQSSKPLEYEIVATGDFNGDGIDDILWKKDTSYSLWYMNADGSHAYKLESSKPLEYKVVGTGDFNGDGIDDVLWRKDTSTSLWYMKEGGGHTYKLESSKPLEYKVATIGDYNGDGIDDVLWRNESENSFWYMKADGGHIYVKIKDKNINFTAY
jgi:uncharacterized protein YkwD